MSSSSKANASSTPEALQALPSDWVPGEHDVVIGKGKKFYFHTGNQWLRTLVASMLEEYKIAQTKSDKSNIISDVVEYVRQHGRFVKRDIKSGKWVMAEPLLCREKCSQTFRDNLAETYRSSNVAKRNKRRAEQQEKKRVPQAKRIRTDGVSGVGAPTAAVSGMPPLNGMALNLVQQHQQAHQAQVQAPAPIPANLFDLGDMPKQRSNSLLTGSLGGLDFSALSRGSITGSAGGMDNGLNLGSLNFNNNANVLNNNNNNNNNNGNNGNVHNNNAAPAPQLNLNGLNSVNLMQSLPDILSNLTQLVSNQNQAAAPAPTADGTTVGNSYNPFEPTPMGAFGLPPLTGEHQAPAAASMPTLDLQNLGALFEPQQPMQEKRHSLALIGDSFDWLKAANNAAAGNTTQEDDAKIPTAFAA